MPQSMEAKQGSAEEDSKKLDKLSSSQRHQTMKNRYFNLDMSNNEYHKVLYKY